MGAEETTVYESLGPCRADELLAMNGQLRDFSTWTRRANRAEVGYIKSSSEARDPDLGMAIR